MAITVAAGMLVLSIALGIRQTFGLFLAPMSDAHVASLPVLALSLAIQNLVWGISQPWVGSLSDRYGAPRVAAGGALVYALGLLVVALHPGVVTAMLGFGVLIGLAQSGTTFAVVISAVSRAASNAQRATAVALATAGGSLGQVALVPIAQSVLALSGVGRALLALAIAALLVLPAAWALGNRRPGDARGAAPRTASWTASWTAIWAALRDRNYLLLAAGFFACGFQLAFIAIHLPTYLSICHVPASVGANALAAIGFFNIIGSYGFGKLMDRVPPQLLLAVLYAIRSTAITGFVALAPTPETTMLFAVVMGVVWLGTVPLTNGVIARLYGTANLGALFGMCFLVHQIGSFLGAWLGGVAVAQTGSYALMWTALIVVGYGCALINLPIRLRAPQAVPA